MKVALCDDDVQFGEIISKLISELNTSDISNQAAKEMTQTGAMANLPEWV